MGFSFGKKLFAFSVFLYTLIGTLSTKNLFNLDDAPLAVIDTYDGDGRTKLINLTPFHPKKKILYYI